MRKILATSLAALVLLGAVLTPRVMGRRPDAAGASPAPERHPMIQKAIGALEHAKDDLQDAAHDFCGHRVEALEATNNAINQLRLALESDRAGLGPSEIYPAG